MINMKKNDFTDQVVMISGAAGQLGQTFVNGVIEGGGRVIGLDVSLEGLMSAFKENNWDDEQVCLLEADIRNRNAVVKSFEAGIDRFGKVSSQINNAGLSVFEPWSERSEEEIDLVMDVNLKGTFNCLQVYLKYCISNHVEGAIVNIASHYGIVSPDPRIYTDCARRSPEIYGATKAGVIQMTKYFAVNARHDGAKVRVNAVAPGGIRNPWDPQGEDFQRLYGDRCPMGRMAELAEILGPVLFLLSPEASYINGHTLVVDGGVTAW
jgi:NAD(P)-dependent dehydrogenase (short-subunit alcohol dehydrogenase family)